jgi:hypothetical protein
MVDFTRYQPPGVFVEDNTAPLVTTTGVFANTVCIIGAAQGYQTGTEVITARTATGAYLSVTGIYQPDNESDVGAPVVKTLGGTTLVLGTQGNSNASPAIPASGDYSLTVDSAGRTIVQLVANGPNSGSNTAMTVQVSYNYTDDSYHSPITFDDYDTLVEVYGSPLVSSAPANPDDSQVLSPLSLGAKIAFENGANEIIAVALDPLTGNGTVDVPASLQDQFKDAYNKILANPNVAIVVPVLYDNSTNSALSTASGALTLVQDLLTHCEQASNDAHPRIGIVGLMNGVDEGDSVGAALTIAEGTHSNRIVLAYPDALYLYNGQINQTTVVGGCFLAAAYAGRLGAIPVSKALTKETIRSFVGVPPSTQKLMTKSTKDSLSSAGVAVTEVNRQGSLSVRHGVATDMGSVLTREISITRARDVLVQSLQTGLESSGIIGQPIDLDMPLRVKAAVMGIMDNATNQGILIAYKDLKVRQSSIDPTVIEVKFAYQPALPLNYVVVSFSIDLSSGVTDLTSDATTTA